MSEMRAPVRVRNGVPGGIISYPLGRLYEEVAFIAYHFHWQFEEIMNLEHRERKQWVEEISKINQKMSGENQRSFLEV